MTKTAPKHVIDHLIIQRQKQIFEVTADNKKIERLQNSAKTHATFLLGIDNIVLYYKYILYLH